MMIDRNNYEAYLMDYLDGKLTVKDVDSVLIFLESNLDIKQELERINMLTISADETSFDFSALKKPSYDIAYPQFEPLLIAQTEGNLTKQEFEQLQMGLQRYPELKQDILLFTKTKLQPNIAVVCADKERLKKQLWYIPFAKTAARVAAVLFLTSSVWFTFTHVLRNQQQLALQTIPNSKPKSVTIETASTPRVEKEQKKVKRLLKKPITKNSIDIKQLTVGIILTRLKPVMQVPLSQLKIPVLSITPNLLADQQPLLVNIPKDEYHSIFEHVKRQFIKRQYQVRESAGVVINKSQATGKINHIEIASLGIEWSHSK